MATAGEYYQQATQLASIAKDDAADKTEWLPLGVFALSRGDTGVSNTVLQLAVSKEGVISGTYILTTRTPTSLVPSKARWTKDAAGGMDFCGRKRCQHCYGSGDK